MRPTDSGCSRSFSRTLLATVLSLGVLIALALAVLACGGGEGTIVGVWEDSTGYTFEFTADGKFVSADTMGLNMTYVIQGNEITFNSDFGGGTTVEYSVDGDTMQIEDYGTGEFMTATRVE